MFSAAYQTKQWVMKMVHDLLELLFHAAGLIIDTLRTFILIVLAILGPIVLAVWDGLAGSLTAWFSRYISVYLWLPVSSILTALLTKIQVLMIEKDIEALSDPNYPTRFGDMVLHRLLPYRYCRLLLCTYRGRLDYRSWRRYRLLRS